MNIAFRNYDVSEFYAIVVTPPHHLSLEVLEQKPDETGRESQVLSIFIEKESEERYDVETFGNFEKTPEGIAIMVECIEMFETLYESGCNSGLATLYVDTYEIRRKAEAKVKTLRDFVDG